MHKSGGVRAWDLGKVRSTQRDTWEIARQWEEKESWEVCSVLTWDLVEVKTHHLEATGSRGGAGSDSTPVGRLVWR